MSTAEIQRCHLWTYWTGRQHQAIQYDGANTELIAQLTKGQASVMQAMPATADNSAPAKDLLLLGDTHTNFLQQIEVGDYIIWSQPPDDANADGPGSLEGHPLRQPIRKAVGPANRPGGTARLPE